MGHNYHLANLAKISICSDPNIGKIDKIAAGLDHTIVLFENGMLYGKTI